MFREPALIRVGETVINLANVLTINLDWRDSHLQEDAPSMVAVAFAMRGMDELDRGQNFTEP